jgi:hypothetical protein
MTLSGRVQNFLRLHQEINSLSDSQLSLSNGQIKWAMVVPLEKPECDLYLHPRIMRVNVSVVGVPGFVDYQVWLDDTGNLSRIADFSPKSAVPYGEIDSGKFQFYTMPINVYATLTNWKKEI